MNITINTKNTSKLIIFVIVIAILSMILIRYSSINDKDASISVYYAPKDAAVTIGGQVVKTSGSNMRLHSGGHQIIAEREGFETYSRNVEIIPGENDKYFILLSPDSVVGEKYTEANISEFLHIEGIVGEEAIKQGNEMRKKNPIIGILPYQGALFSIGHREATEQEESLSDIVVVIRAAEPQNRVAAIQFLQRKGYSPENYIIKFADIENSTPERVSNE